MPIGIANERLNSVVLKYPYLHIILSFRSTQFWSPIKSVARRFRDDTDSYTSIPSNPLIIHPERYREVKTLLQQNSKEKFHLIEDR